MPVTMRIRILTPNPDIQYIAGCTDPNYSHPACPQKLYFQDQQWLGLVRCGTSDDVTKKDEEWAGCKEKPNQSLDVAPSKCDCDGKQPLFKDSPSLDGVASLPSDLDGTISYYPGHTPTMRSTKTPPASSPTSSAGPSSAASSSTSTSDPPITSSPTTNSPSILTSSAAPDAPGLSLGAKLGAGIGSGAGVLLIGAMVFMAILLRKRKKNQQQQQGDRVTTQPDGHPPATEVTRAVNHGEDPLGPTTPSEFRSELPADEPKSARSNMTSSSAGSPLASPAMLPPYNHRQHGVAAAPQQQQRYQAYDPRVHGDYGSQQQQQQRPMGAQTPGRYGSIPISLHHPETQQQQQQQQQPPMPHVSEMQG
ncbi:hypothetical protein SLS62_008339 [Diatrype stigma]|uniref:Uncharacterized protein n=1 Tax=Diatrype stigma TaxID=117547 RepID=A0AAN9UT99_9PEZI